MRNAMLDEAQAGMTISGRNINNLRHADNTTLMAESKELNSLLMKVKEEMKGMTLTRSFYSTHCLGGHVFEQAPGELFGDDWAKELDNFYDPGMELAPPILVDNFFLKLLIRVTLVA